MKRFLLFPLVGIIAALGLGSAAALGLTGGTSLGAADTVVSSCDSDGVVMSMTTALHNFPPVATEVTVEISDIDADGDGTACTTIQVILTKDGAPETVLDDSDEIAITGASMTFPPVSSHVKASELGDIHIVLR
jgi:hypothetical protein